MYSYIIIAFRNLKQARRRTLLLSSALAFISLFLVLSLAWSQSFNEYILRSVTTLVSGHVNVSGVYKTKMTDAVPMIVDTPKVKQLAESNANNPDSIVIRDRRFVRMISHQYSMDVYASGVDISKEPNLVKVLQLAKESEYKKGGSERTVGDVNRLSKKHEVLLFAQQAKRLGVEVGDPLTLVASTGNGGSNAIDVTVGAIAKSLGGFSNYFIFTPIADMGELFGNSPKAVSTVMIYLKDPEQAVATMTRLRESYEKSGFQLMDHDPGSSLGNYTAAVGQDWLGQKLDLTTWKDEMAQFEMITTALDSVTYLVSAILMIIVGIGIMNAMWIAVRERTREVGTLRSIGMARRRILAMFLIEALMLGLFGTTIGVLLGAGIGALVNVSHVQITSDIIPSILRSDTLSFSLSFVQMVKIVAILTLVTGVSAIGPALRAARMQPITAMQKAD